MPPARDCLPRPVVRVHLLHSRRPFDQRGVVLDGYEVRVRPLLVQVVEVHQVLIRKRRRSRALAPGGDDEPTPGLEHSHHLLDVLLLVRHVLAGLARPHQVEGVVREVHRQRVHHPERRVWQVLLRRQLCGPLDLLRREGDAGDPRVRPERLGDVSRCTPYAAPHVEHLRGFVGALGPGQHLVAKVELGLDEVLHLASQQGARALGQVLVTVVPQVDVLAPVVLEDLFLGPRVVLPPHGGPVHPRPAWSVQIYLQPVRRERQSEPRGRPRGRRLVQHRGIGHGRSRVDGDSLRANLERGV